MDEPCPFCEINLGRAPATFVHEWSDTIAIVPLNPVVDGHTLVIPKQHVRDFASDPVVAGATMQRAAQLMRWTDRPMNLITSRGREATQSVFHLHLHLVPRAEDDGLALPWHSGRSRPKTQIHVQPDPPHVAEAIRDIRRFGPPPRHS
ncbi:HIT family protein [Streptomyces chartreusis]|uniref:HIT family protein n=1 Tax=Streptomyces chartreusis TaxID=1969 RepID=UPI003D9238CE